MGWHLTGERKYLDALLKAGQAPDVQRVLDYIQSAKVTVGEMALWAVPTYDDGYWGLIDPARDWYKTPLLQAEGSRNGVAPAEQNSRNE